jgi:hypothetical protein
MGNQDDIGGQVLREQDALGRPLGIRQEQQGRAGDADAERA